jgi:HprK-related kinase A
LIVKHLTAADLRRHLAGPGLRLRTGPIVTAIRSRLDAVERGIALHYAEHPVETDAGFADFHISIDQPRGLRRWWRPQVCFRFDGSEPFAPLPGGQGFPMLEWGMNWCVSAHCHQYLVLHAGVVERDGRALILPAPSGSGKSTLTAALALRGWRLLSDELALIDPASGRVTPLPRPISLKNASIEVMRRFEPSAVFGPVVHETNKGAVVHVRPPVDAVRHAAVLPLPHWVVVPRFVPDAAASLDPLSKGRALMTLVENAFNYNVHGQGGFHTLARLVEGARTFTFTYSRLADAVDTFDALAGAASDATAPGQ